MQRWCFGNPDSFKAVDPLTFSSLVAGLQDASFDVLIAGLSRTVEREVHNSLTFSTPYYYDGASYNGNATFVTCAYDQKRHQECEVGKQENSSCIAKIIFSPIISFCRDL